MATLAEKNPDIVVIKVDIKEPDSPVARAYNVQNIPYFEVFDGKGNLLAEGEGAVKWLDKAMEEAGLTR